MGMGKQIEKWKNNIFPIKCFSEASHSLHGTALECCQRNTIKNGLFYTRHGCNCELVNRCSSEGIDVDGLVSVVWQGIV